MKDKNLAAILALFLGGFGVHKFYLNKIGQGVLYAMFCWTFIPTILGFLDFILLLVKDKDDFDFEYNKKYIDENGYIRVVQSQSFSRNKYQQRDRSRSQHKHDFEKTKRDYEIDLPSKNKLDKNIDYNDGVNYFNNYQYALATNSFERAFTNNPNHPEIHFKLACCYSLMENTQKTKFHLNHAVQFGLQDKTIIEQADALAFIRIQPQFEHWVKSGYISWEPNNSGDNKKEAITVEKESQPISTASLLENLKQLGELKRSGVLTEEEFLREKQMVFS